MSPSDSEKVLWRSILTWMPVSLFGLLVGGGWSLVALDLGTPDVLLVGTLDGSQLGGLLMLLGVGSGVVAVVQAALRAFRLQWGPLRLLVHVVTSALLLAALPVGYVMLLLTAFTTVNEYRTLAVPRHSVVVKTTSWHHRTLTLMEGDGVRFHEVAMCDDPLPLDGYDPFAAGRYELLSRGGHKVLRFARGPGGPFTGEAVLGTRPGDDVSAVCAVS